MSKEERFFKWSKIFLKFIAPAIIISAVFSSCMKRVTDLNQQYLIFFLLIYYLMIWLSKFLFGKTGNRSVQTPKKLIDDNTFKKLEEIALREYEYIRETMAQAMNDRHTLVNYFLLAAGVVIAAIGVVYSEEGLKSLSRKNEISVAICMSFSMIAWIYILKVVRLRQAWCESGAAMNQIKQFFLQNAELSNDETYTPFRWKSSTIPRSARIGNLFHLEVLLISFITSLAIGTASTLLLSEDALKSHYWVPIVFFGFNFFMLSSTYALFLEEKDDEEEGDK